MRRAVFGFVSVTGANATASFAQATHARHMLRRCTCIWMTDNAVGSSACGNETPILAATTTALPGWFALACVEAESVELERVRELYGLASSFPLPLIPTAPARCGRGLIVFGLGLLLLLTPRSAFAQGGPPYYTNDPGTPGPFNWEINLGYMPFFYSGQSVSHTPDVDINFGIGDRIQLTYENAWLRVQNPSTAAQFGRTQFGLGQSNPGVKWRFHDGGEDGLSVSVFPQFFLNNPNDAVRRGITPASQSFLLPFEFTKKLGPGGCGLRNRLSGSPQGTGRLDYRFSRGPRLHSETRRGHRVL